jgi:hypothetical protein
MAASRVGSGGSASLHRADNTVARLWRTRWRPKPARRAVLPGGQRRGKVLVLLGFGRKGPRSAAKWSAP